MLRSALPCRSSTSRLCCSASSSSIFLSSVLLNSSASSATATASTPQHRRGPMRSRSSHTRRQPDIAEWCKQHAGELRELRKYRLKEAPGVLTYMGWGVDFIKSMRQAKKEHAEDKEKEAKGEEAKAAYNPDSPLNQHLRAQEITRRFKWNKVTWDVGADFDGFSNRMMNGDIANKVPAFSHLRMHLIKEDSSSSSNSTSKTDATSSTSDSTSASTTSKKARLTTFTNSLKPGDVTNWFFEEADESAPLVPFERESTAMKSPYRVDWETAEVYVLDTASPEELLSFLRGPAHALQTLQFRHNEDETQMNTDIDNTRIYLNAFIIKYNEFDRSSFSDVARRANPRTYVDPPQIKKFCQSAWNNSIILRHYLKDQNIRILPPGEPYRIDPETKEVCIPADFEEYNTSGIHGVLRPFQRIVVSYRKTLYLWGLIGLVMIGDTEFL